MVQNAMGVMPLCEQGMRFLHIVIKSHAIFSFPRFLRAREFT
ncbi:hypothetical protein SOHN41_01203 [Shewanella sp. HN-41]|nr:hypothetical protein SOHN41_01203 [Shewanella sp. HN-41]